MANCVSEKSRSPDFCAEANFFRTVARIEPLKPRLSMANSSDIARNSLQTRSTDQVTAGRREGIEESPARPRACRGAASWHDDFTSEHIDSSFTIANFIVSPPSASLASHFGPSSTIFAIPANVNGKVERRASPLLICQQYVQYRGTRRHGKYTFRGQAELRRR